MPAPGTPRLKTATFVGGLIGLALLVALGIHADIVAMARTLRAAGAGLLLLPPWRLLFFLLYALGWRVLLRNPPQRLGLGYLLWATAVREAGDRLLPLPSVGGSLIGIRVLRWRGVSGALAAASIITEILLTLIASWLFTGIGLYLLLAGRALPGSAARTVLLFALAVAIPLITFLTLRSGSVFSRLERWLRPWLAGFAGDAAVRLDQELGVMLRQTGRLAFAQNLQLIALLSGSLEVWLALRLFDHAVGLRDAIILESLTQAARTVAFMVPAGLGVQEAVLVVLGHALGIGPELALAVSMAKRIREVICGVPALLSWQYLEGRRARERSRELAAID